MTKSGVERFVDKYGDVFPIQSEQINEYFNKQKTIFREYYTLNLSAFEAAGEAFANIVHLLSRNVLDYAPKTTFRVKDREECLRKFELKYRAELEADEGDPSYEIKDHITDIVGLRVVCLYETDIALVHKAIKDNF